MQQMPLANVEAEFAFLRDSGFQRAEGWQFEVVFERGGIRADYLFLDRELFGHRSGLHGDMFPPEKLTSAVSAVARDIRENYSAVLDGEPSLWERIRRRVQAPREKRRLP
jgi:hypothetical protein